MQSIEYRVRPVTRYIVTKFVSRSPDDENAPQFGALGSSVVGEFHTQDGAKLIADALAFSDVQKAPFHLPKVKWEPMEEPPQTVPA